MQSPLQQILEALSALVVPGVTGKELDDQCAKLIQFHGCKPAFLGYKPPNFGGPEGYPNCLCVSVNEEVIHGIPNDRPFIEGDVIKLDTGVELPDGQFDDGATTVLVGELDPATGHILGTSAVARKLVKATREALDAGTAQAKAGNTTHDIAAAVEAVAKKYDLHVVHGYGGHGISTSLHEPPHIPNEIDGSAPVTLVSGQRLAIEPMFATTGHGFTYVAKDGWTVKLRNNSGLAAHFERTITVE